MAQVYVSTRRRTTSSLFEEELQRDSQIDIPRIADSIYVFPSPPSADPDCSDSPTHFTTSSLSLSERPSLLLLTDDDSFTWDDIQSTSTGFHSRTTSFGSLLPPRQPLPRRSFGSLRSKTSIDYLIPQPRTHIPLLSFFLSFLTVDETVVQLLSVPSTSSTLFPGSHLADGLPSSIVNPTEDWIHGLDDLLCPPKSTDSLRDGFEQTLFNIRQEPSLASDSEKRKNFVTIVWEITRSVTLGTRKALGAG
ncbi:hypothetical protein DL96DRAFT_181419 [Flagelloscypha sp. PMI_526]|jgi:hypothetical protein|nr:hypothetical protein DL96DRAFT_181419 [Flagelloscypha sp. PMI_526]